MKIMMDHHCILRQIDGFSKMGDVGTIVSYVPKGVHMEPRTRGYVT